MAIITRPPATILKKAITIRMPEPLAETLHQYAEFLDSSLDHIAVEALKLVFKKDAEFKAWRDQQRTPVLQVVAQRDSSSAAPPLFLPKASATGIAPQEEKAERVDQHNHAVRSVGASPALNE